MKLPDGFMVIQGMKRQPPSLVHALVSYLSNKGESPFYFTCIIYIILVPTRYRVETQPFCLLSEWRITQYFSTLSFLLSLVLVLSLVLFFSPSIFDKSFTLNALCFLHGQHLHQPPDSVPSSLVVKSFSLLDIQKKKKKPWRGNPGC